MTRKLNIKTTITGIAATLALVLGLFAAPDAMAGERGKRWNGGRGHHVERHVERYRGHRPVYRPAPRRHIHRHVPRRPYRHYVERRDFPVGAVILGIGAGIITHAIISNHYHD